MKALKAKQILLAVGAVLLVTGMVKVMFSQGAQTGLEPKAGVKPSQAGARAGKPSTKAFFENASKVLVFRIESKQRKYVGSIGKGTPSWKNLCDAVEKGTTLKDVDIAYADYEILLAGRGFYQWAKVDSSKGMMAISTSVIRLGSSINQLFADAKPTKPRKGFKPKVKTRVQLLPPPTLEEVVTKSSLIIIGIPIDIIANEYERPGGPNQHTVYAIFVERYLKDETGLNMPVVFLSHYGGYLGEGDQWPHDPLPTIGSRYLFFLVVPWSPYVSYFAIGVRARRYYEGEWSHYPEALLANGWSEPVREDVNWLRGKEQGFWTGLSLLSTKHRVGSEERLCTMV